VPTRTRRDDLAATAAIVWAAFLFGTSFVVVKGGLDDVDPIPYLALRFTIASVVLASIGSRRPSKAGEARAGAVTGVTYLLGFMAQTIGLQYTTPSASAFLTYLLIVLVPFVTWIWQGRRPTLRHTAAVAVAFGGLALLTGKGVGFGKGELLTTLGAVAFAVHLVQQGTYSHHDPFRFNAIQAAVVAVPCLVLTPFTGGLPTAAAGWWVCVYAALVVTCLTYIPWSWAARRIDPMRASLIFLTEPIFATLASYVDGERLSAAALVGAGLILAAAVVSELASRRPAPSARGARDRSPNGT